ncbi:MAG: glycosyltransferase [Candidatus Hydrogenedentes bacterium]|nr:glycosyltransferase [Candidatus Hydrogenedentota bacterium]
MEVPTGSSSDPASVSILLVVKNGRADLERSLPLIRTQDYGGDVELVCVDSGSTDGTVALMRDHGAQIREIPPEEFHHGRTRNLAASMASHEILVCLSQDAIPTDTAWLRHLVTAFVDPRVGGVYGKQTAPEGMGVRRRQSLSSEYPDLRQVRDPDKIERYSPGHFRFSNANAAVRKSCWERFPWDETVLLAEDQGLCRDMLMAGMVVIYEPAAEVIHGHERSLWGEFKYALDNGLSLTGLGILNNPEIGGEMRYGLKRMGTDLAHFGRRGRIDCVILSLASFFVRYLGVQLGKREKRLPHWFLRRVSEMHGKLEG